MLELQKVYITTNFLLFLLFTLFSFHFSSYLGDEEVFANVLSQVSIKVKEHTDGHSIMMNSKPKDEEERI